VPLLGGEKDTDSVAALLDGGTALLGDPGLVRAAIDRRGGKQGIDAALIGRIASLRERYDVWGVGERPDGFAAPMPEAKALESIDRFQFGLQFASGLDLAAEIHARSPEDAEKLRMTLGMLAGILKPQQASEGAAKFDLQVDNGTLKLHVSIPEEELKKAIQEGAEELLKAGPPTAISKPRDSPRAAPQSAGSQLLDKDGNTVVLKLPGKR
jgi:hypothetical protein